MTPAPEDSQAVVPPEVAALAEARAQAREAKDFAASDALREQISELGWQVRDTAAGAVLAPRPPYEVLGSTAAMPDRSAEPDVRAASVAVLVEGWPDDVERCLEGLVQHLPADVPVLALDLGDVDGAGRRLHEVASRHPGRIEAWHLEQACGWAQARLALLRADAAAAHVWCDPAIELTGDALTPLLGALADPAVVAAGGFGVNVAADWLSFEDAKPGEVDALNGYFAAFRRDSLLAIGGPHPKATFYRNADLEMCFALREAGGRVVMTEPLPVEMHRHRGYYDTDPELRDQLSRKNYDRFLRRFRTKRAP